MNANGIKLFASHYNAFNIKAADQMVLAGKFAPAKRLYRLVERFDPGEINRSQAKERLALVERIEAAKNRAELLRHFEETQSRVGSVTNLESADPKKAQKVDDLLLMKP